MNGFDFCADQAENALFNVDQYSNTLAELGFYVEKIDSSMLNKFYHSDEDYDQFIKDDATIETKLLMILLEHMHCWLESERDMLVTSMIDNMEEEDYKRNYRAVWGEEPE